MAPIRPEGGLLATRFFPIKLDPTKNPGPSRTKNSIWRHLVARMLFDKIDSPILSRSFGSRLNINGRKLRQMTKNDPFWPLPMILRKLRKIQFIRFDENVFPAPDIVRFWGRLSQLYQRANLFYENIFLECTGDTRLEYDRRPNFLITANITFFKNSSLFAFR